MKKRLLNMRMIFGQSRWMPAVFVIALSLGVLGTTILMGSLKLRSDIRKQIVGRDAQVLYEAVGLLHQDEMADQSMVASIEDTGEQVNLMLKVSRMKGIIGIRLFSPEGQFIHGEPAHIKEGELAGDMLSKVKNLESCGRFYPRINLGNIVYTQTEEGETISLLEVVIPLHRNKATKLAGIAQFLIEGHSIAAEYAKLDEKLILQAGLAFVVGGLVLSLSLGWAFYRLAERTTRLQLANQELARMARTSAIGAVTAHLIHGLKNPLAGLQHFVYAQKSGDMDVEADWDNALATTRRMNHMINEVVSVLREEEHANQYEITLAEFFESLHARFAKEAAQQGIQFEVSAEDSLILSSRTANLTGLILSNLLQNGIQALSRGNRLWLRSRSRSEEYVFEVGDNGGGMPEEVRKSPFTPHKSCKADGCGIGLVISHQLASHLGGRLELIESSSAGSRFELVIPRALLTQADCQRNMAC